MTGVDDACRAVASLADGGRPTSERASALTTLTLLTLAHPARLTRRAIEACVALLRWPGQGAVVIEQALGLVAAAIYGRPDLVDGEVARAVAALFPGPPLAPPLQRKACDTLGLLLTTPGARQAVADLLGCWRARRAPPRPRSPYSPRWSRGPRGWLHCSISRAWWRWRSTSTWPRAGRCSLSASSSAARWRHPAR